MSRLRHRRDMNRSVPVSARLLIPPRAVNRYHMVPPRPRPRAVLISVLLVLALGLAGLLAFNAQAQFRDHRATAERVLRDYARLAAARFGQRTAQNLSHLAYWPIVDAFGPRRAATQPAPPATTGPV